MGTSLRRNWTREETILAFELYCTIPACKVTVRNERIIALAHAIDRTPGSVKLKLQNFKAYDPNYTQDGRLGLSHGSKTDKTIVEEFLGNWDAMVSEAIHIRATIGIATSNELTEQFPKGETVQRIVQTRIGQNFFRNAVLSAYNNTCCITGIACPELLIASHIKPWCAADCVGEKTNPQNGLCLNAFHDKAFDRGLITVNTEYEIIVSSKVKKFNNSTTLSEWLYAYEGKRIQIPERFAPKQEFIEYHNDVIFQH